MPDFKTIQAFENALDRAIDSVMQGRVADGVKEQIATSVQEDVYDVYDPKFYSRFGSDGGMKDKSFMTDHYDAGTKTLTVEHEPLWQHLRGGAYPTSDLSEVVQNNQIYGAPPRKYIDEAENTYAKSAFQIDLEVGLREKGF